MYFQPKVQVDILWAGKGPTVRSRLQPAGVRLPKYKYLKSIPSQNVKVAEIKSPHLCDDDDDEVFLLRRVRDNSSTLSTASFEAWWLRQWRHVAEGGGEDCKEAKKNQNSHPSLLQKHEYQDLLRCLWMTDNLSSYYSGGFAVGTAGTQTGQET